MLERLLQLLFFSDGIGVGVAIRTPDCMLLTQPTGDLRLQNPQLYRLCGFRHVSFSVASKFTIKKSIAYNSNTLFIQYIKKTSNKY